MASASKWGAGSRRARALLGVLACFVFWFVLFGRSGLFDSSFHLIDEHFVIDIQADLARPGATVVDVLTKWVSTDFGERRFRPLYYTTRVLRTAWFGLAWPHWAAYNAILAASTSAALFLFGLRLGFGTASSLGLAALSSLGHPSTIWWRLGTPETEGNFLLALTLLFVALAVTRPQGRKTYENIAIVFAILASLTKEGMILYLPAVAAVRLWVPCWREGAGLRGALREAWPFVLVLALVTVLELVALLVAVGTRGTGYAGVDATSFDLATIGANWKTLNPVLALKLSAGAASGAVVLHLLQRGRADRAGLLPLTLAWLAFAIGAIPQVLLYAKSGWADHYFNPVVISGALLLVCSIEDLRRRSRWVYWGLVLLLLLLQINPRYRWTREHAKAYAADGTALQHVLRTVSACSPAAAPLLIVANPRVYYEEAFSLRSYLSRVSARERIYLATVGAAGAQIHSDALSGQESARQHLDPKTLEEHYFQGATLASLPAAEREACGAILILSPKNVEPDFRAGAASWFHGERFSATDFDLAAVPIRLYCRSR